MRQDSSNFEPCLAWGVGCQMVCMNTQTWDLGMRLERAKFALNGNCGYVLRPARDFAAAEAALMNAKKATLRHSSAAAALTRRQSKLLEEKGPSPSGKPLLERRSTEPGRSYDPGWSHSSEADTASAALPPAGLQQLDQSEVAEAVQAAGVARAAEAAARFEQVLASLALPAAAVEEMRGFDHAKKRQLVAMHSAGRVAAAAAAAAAAMPATGADGGGKDENHEVLTLRLICGRELPKPNEQCCVAEPHDRLHPASVFGKRPTSSGGISAISITVEVHGGGRFCGAVPLGAPFTQGAAYSSAIATGGGLSPEWEEPLECIAERADDALVSFHVYDRSGGGAPTLLAYEALPMHALRPGYRAIRLRAPSGSRLQFGALLVHMQLETRAGSFRTSVAQRGARRRSLGPSRLSSAKISVPTIEQLSLTGNI